MSFHVPNRKQTVSRSALVARGCVPQALVGAAAHVARGRRQATQAAGAVRSQVAYGAFVVSRFGRHEPGGIGGAARRRSTDVGALAGSLGEGRLDRTPP